MEIRTDAAEDFVKKLKSHSSPNDNTINKFRDIPFDSIDQKSMTQGLNSKLFTLTAQLDWVKH